MFSALTVVFIMGAAISFYLNNRKEVDKTKDKLEDLFS